MNPEEMIPEEMNRKLVAWIREQVEGAGAKGVVLGMSGGIDSAVVAVLCKQAFPQSTLGVMMPCHSNPQDEEHARIVAEKLSIPFKVVVLDPVFDATLKVLPEDNTVIDPAFGRKASANLKPRLRMLTLYYFSNRLNYMVVGSGNRSELAIGYFTKYGDGGVDILPIGNLVKAQVRELALFLGIPQQIIDKPPSAGLWEGQTDESEMGISYAELDGYLSGQHQDGLLIDCIPIESMIKRNMHKCLVPPIPGSYR